MKRFNICFGLLVTCLILTSSAVQAQHFEPANDEGPSHSLIIQSATIDDQELGNNDEIGVFTPDGVCAGSVVIADDPPHGLAAYGDDPGTPDDVEGFLEGEEFSFKLWDGQDEVEAHFEFVGETQTWEQDVVTSIARIFFYNDPIPVIGLDTFEHDFGLMGVDHTAEWILTITNIGFGELTISDVYPSNQVFDTDFENEIILQPAESHDLLVTFTPSSEDNFAGTLTIENDDPDNDQIMVNLTGSGTNVIEPLMALSHQTLDFEEWPTELIRTLVLTISNAGTGDLTIDNIVVEGNLFDTDWDGNDIVITPQQSHDLSVTFAPEAVELYEGSLTISSDDPGGEAIVDLVGIGIDPQTHFRYVETDLDHSLLIVNSTLNGEPLEPGDEIGVKTEDGVCAGGDVVEERGEQIGFGAFGRSGNIDGFTAGEEISFFIWDMSSDIEVEATPDIHVGSIEWVDRGLAILDLEAETPFAPYITVSPEVLDFGQIGSGYEGYEYLQIRNIGTDYLRVTNIVSDDPDHFDPYFRVGFIVRPGGSRWVRVTFTPDDITTFDAQLTIYSNTPGNEEMTVDVTGEGIDPPAMIDVNATEYDFGEVLVDEVATWDLIITNIGGEDLTIQAVQSDNNVFTHDYSDGETVLQPDESLTVEVTFAPVAYINYMGTLTIFNDDPDQEDQELGINLSGSGLLLPDITVDPLILSFRNIEINTSASRDVTITNDGDANLWIYDISVTGEYLTVDFDGEFFLAPGEEHIFQAHFNPTELGDWEGRITIESNDENEGPVNILVILECIFINYPPEVVEPIDNQVLQEDFDGVRVADLLQIFADENDDELFFTVEDNQEQFTTEIQEGHYVYMEADQDWFGVVTVTVTADDQFGGRDLGPVRSLRTVGNQGIFPGRDTPTSHEFDVEVQAVNDSPVWTEFPEDFIEDEPALIEFNMAGTDVEGDDLSIVYASETIPDAAQFNDNGDGTASFYWQTTFFDAGDYTATFTLSDYEYDVEAVLNISIADINQPPEWVDFIDSVDGFEGEELTIDLVGFDLDENDLTIVYSSDDLPEAVEFTDHGDGTGTFVWTPTYDEEGDYTAIFTLSDIEFDVVGEIAISIANVNRAPVWDDIPTETINIDEEDVVDFTMVASDPDGQDLTISYNPNGTPDAAQFNDNGDGTATFYWETTLDDAGNYIPIFTVTDGDLEVEAEVVIMVGETNQPPVWENIPETAEGNENTTIEFTMEASDQDEDELEIVYTSGDLPDGVNFTDHGNNTATFSWDAGYDDAGEYTATFTLLDGFWEVSHDVAITVNNINRPPVWDSIPGDYTVDEAALIEFTVVGSDPDVEDEVTITYDPDGLPEGVEFTDQGDGTATFYWQTWYEDAGQYVINFTISDGVENVVSNDVIIIVNNVNAPPYFIDPIEEYYASEQELIEIGFEAADYDGDDITLTFTRGSLPDDVHFTDHGNGTGILVWQTDHDDAGRYNCQIRASDDGGHSITHLDIIVSDVNMAPTWEYAPAIITIEETEFFDLTVIGEDLDGDDLTIEYESDDIPEEAEFTDHGDGTATLTWQTGYEDAGVYQATFTISDGEISVPTIVRITVNNLNRVPVWDVIPEDVVADEDDLVEFVMSGHDPDGSDLTITFSSHNLPLDVSFTDFGNGRGEFSWQTSFDDAGDYTATFTLSDGEDMVDIDVDITIGNINHEPEWVDIPPAVHAPNEGDLILFDVFGEDVDDDELIITYRSDDLPGGEDFTDHGDGSGTFEWQTGGGHTGIYFVTFILSDDEFDIEEVVIITVGDVNRPPEFTRIPGSIQIGENSLLEFSIEAMDPDDDNLTIDFTSDDLPEEAQFTDHGDGTGDFSWQPTYDEAGLYLAVFTLSDGIYNIVGEVQIRVNDVNQAPEWTQVPRTFAGDETTIITFDVSGIDADDDYLTITFDSEDPALRDAAEFTDNRDGTGRFRWVTTYDDAGIYYATFRLSDGVYTVSEVTTIRVNNVNREPVWDIYPDYMTIDEGVLINFLVRAIDPDGTEDLELSYTHVGIPDVARFTDHGNGYGIFTWQTNYDDEGRYWARFAVTDGELEATVSVRIDVEYLNREPYWVGVPDPIEGIEGLEDEVITFNVAGDDPDDDADLSISYYSDDLPDDVDFTDNRDGTGTFNWMPDFDDSGEYLAIFTLSDDEAEVTTEVPITITHVNRAPEWDDPPRLIQINEGEELQLTVAGIDPDGDELSVAYRGGDISRLETEFADHGDGSGTLTWHPDFDQSGEYAANFELSDGRFRVELTVTIIVNHVNRPPEFVEIPERAEADEGQWVAFSLEVFDPDDDDISVIMESENLPVDVSFSFNPENGTGTFTWQTDYEDEGDYVATFTVSDGPVSISEDVSITVNHVNVAPFWTNVPDVVEGDELVQIQFLVQGGDIDDDDLTVEYSSDDIGDDATFRDFGNGAGRFTWRPGFDDQGDHHATFTLSDGEFSIVTEVLIIIENVNREPVWDEIPIEIFADENDWIEFDMSGSDPDGDDLIIRLVPGDLPNIAHLTDNGDGTASFEWQTGYNDAGTHTATFILSDGVTDVAGTTTIIIDNVNRPPRWISVPVFDDRFDEGDLVSFLIRGYDPDGDDLTLEYSSNDLPEEVEFVVESPGLGSFSWQTTNEDWGLYYADFTLSDGVETIEAPVQIAVGDVNRPPQLEDVPGAISVDEGNRISFTIYGTDPDYDRLTLTYSSDDLPENVEFSTRFIEGRLEGTFLWETGFGDAGEYSALFTLSDEEIEIEAQVDITVESVNHSPYWVVMPDVVDAVEAEFFSFGIAGEDPDGDDLTITFTSDNLPEDATVSDRGDGTGQFLWITTYDDAGSYSVSITLSDGELSVTEDVVINVTNANRPPIWTVVVEEIRSEEDEIIVFDLAGTDPDGDRLAIHYERNNIPDEARFVDNLDGSGVFRWRPNYLDAGVYSALFTLSDGDLGVELETSIIVEDVNRPPIWTDYPAVEYDIIARVDEETSISITAIDPDGDAIEYDYRFLDEEIGDTDFEVVDGSAVLTVVPNRFEFDSYPIRFTASDGEQSARLEFNIFVFGGHFLAEEETGRMHSVRIDWIDHYLNDPDEFDELAAITPAGTIAGLITFGEEDPPWSMTIWGDDPATHLIDGYRTDEPFRFLFWDHDLGVENGVRTEVVGGDPVWRHDGFSVLRMLIAPEVSATVANVDFGLVRIERSSDREITFTSTGQAPVTGLQLNLEGIGFELDDDGPVDLDQGEEWTVTITFSPGEAIDYAAMLHVTSDYTQLDMEITGTGVRMRNFEYEITSLYHQIDILSIDVGREIGIFTPVGMCAGAVNIAGDAPWELYAWGDDPETLPVEGFRTGDAFTFKIWDGNEELDAMPIYHDGIHTWAAGALTVVSLVTAEHHFNWITTRPQHNIEIDSLDYFGGGLSAGDEIAVVNPRAVVSGGIYRHLAPWRFVIYGDNPNTDYITEGFHENEHIYFRIWKHDEEREYLARPTWRDGDPQTFQDGETSHVYLTVVRDNVAPIFDPMESLVGQEGQLLEFSINASDFNDDAISLALVGVDLPENVIFTDAGDGSGTVSWEPGPMDAGAHVAQFTAFDGWVFREDEVSIRIININHPPEFTEALADQEVDENEPLSMFIDAFDQDGDDLTYTVELAEGMEGAYIDGSLFRWTPNYDQAGFYEDIIFRIVDNGQPPAAITDTIQITVNDVNRGPVWREINPITEDEGALVNFTVFATDPDGQDLELTAGDLPENAEFIDNGDNSGTFNWETGFDARGRYQPYFDASDGELSARLPVLITIRETNRRPIFEAIEDQQVEINETLELSINATDPDEGDQVELVITVSNLPPSAHFTDYGNGVARLVWRPSFEDRGIYPNVGFEVSDPSGLSDHATVVFTAGYVDDVGPVIADLYPGNDLVLRISELTVTAMITDNFSGVDEIEFMFDDEAIDNFLFDEESGEFSWDTEALSEGNHSYSIRATDVVGNSTIVAVAFEINSSAGEINLEPLDRFTNYDRINVSGTSDRFLTIHLFRNGEEIVSTEADRRGRFLFENVQLVNRANWLVLRGYELINNEQVAALEDSLMIYLDIEAPEINVLGPARFINDLTPQIAVRIADVDAGNAVGIDEETGAYLALDRVNIPIDDGDNGGYQFFNNLLTYDIPEDLIEGHHSFSVMAVDRLGNAPNDPFDVPFFVDSYPPEVLHRYFDNELDTINSSTPEINIAVVDPLPSSGIVGDDIILLVDGEPRAFVWNEADGSVYFDFEDNEFDRLDAGLHRIELDLFDNAGNRTVATGEFFIGLTIDGDPPDYTNLKPPDGSVAGLGGGGYDMQPYRLPADTVSAVISDIDAGVDWETVEMRINGELVDGGDMIFQIPPGRVSVPMYNRAPGDHQGDDEMPGLEEGLNEINIFSADEEGNEDEVTWVFFFDATAPDGVELQPLDDDIVNTVAIEVVVNTGGDSPDYPDGYENIASVRIYRNNEVTVEQIVEYNTQDITITGILLVEGDNTLEATLIDGGGNESARSEAVSVFLDMTDPNIVSFQAEGGRLLATDTPTFVAILADDGSGVDPDNIVLTVDGDAVEGQFDNGTFTAQVQDALEEGNYTASLTVIDMAGNESSEDFDFNIDLSLVQTPIFELHQYTSVNRVYLTGEGQVGTDVFIYLDDEEIGSFFLENEAVFEFSRTIVDLPDESSITLKAINDRDAESGVSDPQMLYIDQDPPEFVSLSPDRNERVNAAELESIDVEIVDELAGIDPEGYIFTMNGEDLLFNVTGDGQLTADVSDVDFGDNEAVSMMVSARDMTLTPNTGQVNWQFITLINDAPVVDIPDAEFLEDGSLTINLNEWISDPDNSIDELDISGEITEGAENAEMNINEQNMLQISADENWNGNLTVEITVVDPDELSTTDEIAITVAPVNDSPVLDPLDIAVTIADELFELQVNASDVDEGDDLTFSDNSDDFDIGVDDGMISFIPTRDMLGRNTIVITVTDEAGAADDETLILIVNRGINPPELVQPMVDVEIEEDDDEVLVANLYNHFMDPDEDVLIFDAVPAEDWLFIRITNADLFIQPAEDAFGDAIEVVVSATDGFDTVTDTFLVNVAAVNDPPRQRVAIPLEIILYEDPGLQTIADLDTVFIDVDNQEDLTYRTTGGDDLQVNIDDEHVLTFDPVENWFGVQTFSLWVGDVVENIGPVRHSDDYSTSFNNEWYGQSSTPRRDEETSIDILVEILQVNDTPIVFAPIEDQQFFEDQGPWLVADLDDVFLELEGEIMSYTAQAAEPLTYFIDNDNVLFLDAPLDFFADSLQVTVTAEDPHGDSVSDDFLVDVIYTSDPPVVIQPIDDRTYDEDSWPWEIIDLDDVFYDADRDTLQYDVTVAEPIIFEIDDDNMLILTAPDDYQAADIEVIVTADDGHGGNRTTSFRTVRSLRSTNRTSVGPVRQMRSTHTGWTTSPMDDPRRDPIIDEPFTLTILAVNDAPVWTEIPDSLLHNEEEVVEFIVAAGDIDLDNEGDVLTLTLENDDGTLERGAEFIVNGGIDGMFTWLTDFEDAGDYHLVFKVEDLAGTAITHTVFISVGNVNRPPAVIAGIADQEFDEDSGPWEIADLDDVFSDPDADALEFSISAPEPLVVVVDDEHLLSISVPDNYNATGLSILITTSDGAAVATDTFMVDINFVNDLPTAFSLVSPYDRQVLTNEWAMFKWTESVDVVEDSTISYALVLTFNDTTTLWFRDLQETELLVARTIMLVDSADTNYVEWMVYAFDGVDSLASTETFDLIVAPIGEDAEEEVIVPTELTLGPAYPNPFNDIITIEFDLPWDGMLEISIFDIEGRKVKTLYNDDLNIGSHHTYWDGLDAGGERASSGIYFCHLSTHSSTRIIQIILIR
ncbi:tandem-95 repeat protein [bacterium]|nr:tandem-95 repeat protein [bacterium]